MSIKKRRKRTGSHTKAFAERTSQQNGKKSARRRRLSKKAAWITAAVLAAVVIAVTALVIDSRVVNSTAQYIVSPEEAAQLDADCIMVLGCGLTDDGEPGRNLTRRLETAQELFETGDVPKLLMSGDHGRKDYDEVNAMKDWAVARGDAPDDVFMDHAGFSTYESMYRARDVFDVKSVIIVSQSYHLCRAVYDARALGLDAYGVAAEGGSGIRNDLREMLARCKDWLWCILQPEPTYLGEVIPISGSGALTDDRPVSDSSLPAEDDE